MFSDLVLEVPECSFYCILLFKQDIKVNADSKGKELRTWNPNGKRIKNLQPSLIYHVKNIPSWSNLRHRSLHHCMRPYSFFSDIVLLDEALQYKNAHNLNSFRRKLYLKTFDHKKHCTTNHLIFS